VAASAAGLEPELVPTGVIESAGAVERPAALNLL
jgi:hypothetical protein